MLWKEVRPLAGAGVPVRRRVWLTVAEKADARVLYVAGLGTTRAVAVYRSGGVDTVITAATFSAADRMADDWEAVQ